MKKILLSFALVISAFCHNSYAAQALSIDNATLRSPIPGMANTAGYMVLTNTSNSDIVLTTAKSKIAEKVEYHNHVMNSGVMKMVKLDELIIPAGKTVTFQSGGLHLMFIGLTQRNDLPTKVPVTLISKSGDEYLIEMEVKSIKQHHHHH